MYCTAGSLHRCNTNQHIQKGIADLADLHIYTATKIIRLLLPGTTLLDPTRFSASFMLNTRVFLISLSEGRSVSLFRLCPSDSHCRGDTFLWAGVGGSFGETNSLYVHAV